MVNYKKVNYKEGKIYKIISTIGPKVYIGSTAANYLSQRMCVHKFHYKLWKKGERRYVTVFDLFDEYGPGSCRIKLIENYPCESSIELRMREEYWRLRTPNCINKNAAYQPLDKKEYYKKYRIDHPDQIKAYQQKYLEKPEFCNYCGCECKSKYRAKAHRKTKKHKRNVQFCKEVDKNC